MEKPEVKERVLVELELLISQSCNNPSTYAIYYPLHVALLKKYYNAATVSIDYQRQRIAMDIVIDDKEYKAGKVNINIPTLPTNLLFKNLNKFLKSCVEKDQKSIGFYAQILNSFKKTSHNYALV